MKFLSKSKIALGEGAVTQYILFEWKWLFSIIFYRWETVDQVRFHTHAFPALAFLLKGKYTEQVMDENGDIDRCHVVDQLYKLGICRVTIPIEL